MNWKLNEGIMYLFEETQGIKNFSILQKLKEKFFTSTKNSKKFFRLHENSKQKFSILRKLKSKNFQSYENFKIIFSNPAKIQKKIFLTPLKIFLEFSLVTSTREMEHARPNANFQNKKA